MPFYLCISGNTSQTAEIRWNEFNTRALIDLYGKYKNKVGTLEIRSIRHMWQKIAVELQLLLGVIVTLNNCENRWKVVSIIYFFN